ncbi:hypothetical protein NECAME_03239 [Necator americanus]|uniref:Uncharacterized protein n=1 Tax=Necator americanus TaxID=51031 RepID=W2T686_NECAM|nr:hypothetical protein NECAME_03239 [Necator americanus]ETN77139.1 hypothetical protein NECAME_03239 [Necator americanus]
MINIPDPDLKTIVIIASLVSYVVYNILFLVAQLWEAFATLVLGLYYALIFYGYMYKNKKVMMIGTALQALATVVFFGLFVFFMVEIFTAHSLVYHVLVYIKNMNENKRVEVARNCSIAMTIDSLVTAVLHFWALYFCVKECKAQSGGSLETPIAAIAIHTELEYPEQTDIPRLRTTSYGEIVGVEARIGRGRLSDRHRSMPTTTRTAF